MKHQLALHRPCPTGQEIIGSMRDRIEAARAHEEQLDLMGVQSQVADRRLRERLRRECAELIFAYYCAKLDHPRAYFTTDREQMICARLAQCDDDVSALLYAIDGARSDDWTMGRDPRSTKRYDTPEYLFRSWGQVERFAETRPGYQEGKPHPLAVKYNLAAPNERTDRRYG